MSIAKVAHRYAGALADLVIEKGQQTVVGEELKNLTEMTREVPALREVFTNPAIGLHQKERVLNSLLERLRPSELTSNFLRLLHKNERLQHLEEIYAAFLQEMDDRMGIATAHVTTARPLTEEEFRQVRGHLEKITGKQIRIEATMDPNVIGGVVARIGCEIYDGSIRTQLERIRKQMSQ